MHHPPLTLVARYHVSGSATPLEALAAEYVDAVSAEQTSHGLGLYLDAEASTFTVIHMLATPERMEEHLERMNGFIARGAELAEIRSIDVYGNPGPVLQQAIERNRSAGASIEVHPTVLAGFGRQPLAA